MVEDCTRIMAMYSQWTLLSLVQPTLHPSHQPHDLVANNTLSGIYPSNPQSSRFTPNAPPSFKAEPRPINQSSGSKGKPSKNKTDVDKARWDPIPITYIELFPKLMEAHLITLLYTQPPKQPFKKCYDGNARCDYHVENSGHLTKNYTWFKYKV